MRTITNDFKTELKTMGKEIDAKILYTINGTNYTLGADDLNSVKPHYQSGILKSTMKELEIDSNIDIPLGTIIECKFGVKVNGSFEYISYGHYVVYSSEKQEDTNSYLIKCYDKMLYSMVDYETIKYRNLFDETKSQIGIAWNNSSNSARAVVYIEVQPSTQYTISFNSISGVDGIYNFEKAKKEDTTATSGASQITATKTITTTSTTHWLGIQFNKTSISQTDINNVKIQIQEGSVATEYEPFGNIQYPISIRKYIDLLCFNIGLTFKNKNDYFTNYDKTIENELYLDSNGNSLNYKFRDVLDELAQVTGSIICINEDDDELEIRYPTNADETRTSVSGKTLTLANVDDIKVDDITLTGETTQESTPTPSSPQEVVNVTGRQEVKCVGTNLIGLDTQQYKVNLSAGDKITLRNTGSSSLQLNLYTNYGDSTRNDYWSVSSGSTRTITVAYDTKAIAWNINVSSNGVAWVNKGESILTYEPYQEQVNEINLGKNLYNSNDTTYYYACTYVSGANTNQYKISATGSDVIINAQVASGSSYSASAGTLIPCNYGETIYYDIGNANFGKNFITQYNSNKVSLGFTALNTGYSSGSYTPTNSECKYVTIRIGYGNATSGTEYTLAPIISKSSNLTYSPYFTPIELCKIGTYEDKIFKNSGKNLYNKDKPRDNYYYNNNGEQVVGAGDSFVNISFKPTQNKISTSFASKNGNAYVRLVEYNASGTFIKRTLINTNTTTTLDSNTKSVIFCVDENSNDSFTNLQIEQNSSATEYEPYGNGEWYVKKATGKFKMTDISSMISSTTTYQNNFNSTNGIISLRLGKANFESLNIVNNNQMSNGYSNKFKGSTAGLWNNTNQLYKFGYTDGLIFGVHYTDIGMTEWAVWPSSLQNKLDTYLGDVVFYLPLATPTYTKLNDTLQSQLSNILLLEGLNNITSSVPINLNYVSDMDTINEEFFNQDNVNFGEVYGPVNTIILSRSAESDELAKSTPNITNDEDKIAIKISDNQILNFDGREEYLSGLLNRLSGTTYVQNDYSSKGICYYNLGDRYKAYIFGKYYRCLMLNDDVTIESGLSENVYTELPETAQTDYSKTSTSDRIERQTTLIVDKQTGEIRGLVSGLDNEINGDNGIESRLSTAETTLTNHSATLTFIEENTINEDGSVKALKTSTDYTFDSEGLKIGKSTDDYNSLQDNTGTYYYEKDTMIGKYTKDGSVQKDLALYGKYYYGIDEESDFDVNTFERSDALFLAQLYKNSSNEEGFGHFYNGA